MRAVRCPKCRNSTTLNDSGNCIICGFCVQTVQLRTLRLYLVLVMVTVATVLYAVVVLVAEHLGPPEPSGPEMLAYGFLALSAIIGLLAIFAVRPLMLRRPGSQAVFTALLMQAALAETIPLLGLVLYFVLGSIQWFVIFLALGWLVFTIVGLKLGESVAEYERRLVGEIEQCPQQ